MEVIRIFCFVTLLLLNERLFIIFVLIDFVMLNMHYIAVVIQDWYVLLFIILYYHILLGRRKLTLKYTD